MNSIRHRLHNIICCDRLCHIIQERGACQQTTEPASQRSFSGTDDRSGIQFGQLLCDLLIARLHGLLTQRVTTKEERLRASDRKKAQFPSQCKYISLESTMAKDQK